MAVRGEGRLWVDIYCKKLVNLNCQTLDRRSSLICLLTFTNRRLFQRILNDATMHVVLHLAKIAHPQPTLIPPPPVYKLYAAAILFSNYKSGK